MALRPVSAKRQAEADLRWDVRQLTLSRARWRCQGTDAPGPCGGDLDVHEVAPRSVYPGGHLDSDNTIAICRRHHNWVGDNPAAAAELGLHRYSWEVTTTSKVVPRSETLVERHDRSEQR